MPAARCFQVLGLVTVLLVGAFLEPRLAGAALLLDGLVLVAFLADFRRASRARVVAARRWPVLLVQGAAAEVEVEVATAAPGPLVLRLREGLHPGLAASPLRHQMVVRGPGEGRWRYELLPRRRGEHRAGPLTARILGPWGLAWAQRDLLAAAPVRVYPRVRWEGRVGQLLVLAQRQRLGQVALRVHGMGTEPYALREYLPGDPLAKIHWKATARHGRLVSREDTWERGARLVILLDCARAMASLDGTQSKLDYALAAALALTRVAAARGDQVTVLAFSDRIDRTVRVRSGVRFARLAYSALFDLEARLTEPAYDLAVEAVSGIEPRRATAVFFTSVVDLASAELLRDSLLRLGKRHRSVLVNLLDPELRRFAVMEPSTPAEAFAQAASLELELANRRLAAHLRRGGIRVVSSSADSLALDALDAYLSFYRTPLPGARV
jgi:uncharacterized protein (DUF58 family)